MNINDRTRDEFEELLRQYRDGNKKSDDLLRFLKNKLNNDNNYNYYSRDNYDYSNVDDVIGKLDEIEKKINEVNEERQDLLNEGFAEDSNEVKELTKEYERLIESQRKLRVELNNRGRWNAGQDHMVKVTDNFNYKIRNIIGSLGDMYRAVNDLVEPWAKADQAASNYAKTIATSKAGREALRAQTINNVHGNKLAADLDLSSEEVIEAQLDYSKGIGRNAKITDEGQAALGAMTKVYGGAAKELSVLFEKFGVGPVDTGKHLGKMFAEASKSGLSLEKYADNVNKGLRLAQRYTFSNGLKGMEAMAKRATELHMDMQQIETLANKVGTIEGSITTAAKIQVLGGPFSSLADPMGMFSEAWGDMESLEKRLEKFTENMGHFNKQTGEVEISAFNKQRLRAFAEATGQDYGQIIEQTQQQAKLGEVNAQIARSANASQWDKQTQELFRNTATFENGKAGVSINGDFKSIDELNPKDLEDIRKETQSESEDIKEIASMLRDYFQVESSRKKAQDAQRASWVEKTGIGNGMRGLNDTIAHSNLLLGILNGLLVAQGIAGLLGGFGRFSGSRGIGGLIKGASRKIGGVGKGGKVANAIGRTKNKINGKLFGQKLQSTAGKKYTQVGGRVFNSKGKELFGAAKNNALKNATTVSKPSFLGRAGSGVKNVTTKVGTKVSSAASKVTKPIANLGSKITSKVGTTRIAKPLTKLGTKVGTKFGATSLAALGGTIGAHSISSVHNIGTKLSNKGYTKIGNAFTQHASKQASKVGIKNVASAGGKKIATKTATKIGTKMATGLAKGGVAGLVGAAGNIATDMLVESGKIKKGGGAHTAMKVGSTALEGAALGATIGSILPGIGTAIGGAIGAIGGAVVGGVKAAKARREVALDNKLSAKGIERKGDYGARRLRKIDEALSTGKISKSLRKKMEREGDMALLNEIDKVSINKKKEKEEKREKRRKNTIEFISAIKPSGGLGDKLRSAQFDVQVANFNGKAFDKQAKQSVTAMSSVKRHKVVNTLFGASPIAKSIKYSPIGLLHNRLPKKKEQNLDNTTYVSALDRLKQRGLGELGGLSIGFGKNILPTLVKPFNDRPLNQVSIKGGKLEDGNSTSLQELKKIESKDKIQSQSRFKVEPIEININGTLKLESNNSTQSVDIMSELANNRELKKKIAEIVATELNNYKFAGNKVTRSFGINV